MNERNKPIKEFKYPDGSRMCIAGKVRASWWSKLLSSGELSEEEIAKLAGKGENAARKGADTNKRNFIAMMVYRHFKSGDLTDFVTKDGDFLSNDTVQNVNDKRFATIIKQIFGGGE